MNRDETFSAAAVSNQFKYITELSCSLQLKKRYNSGDEWLQMNRYIKPTHTLHPELLLLLHLLETEKKMKRRGSGRNKKWGKSSMRECVLHRKHNEREIQHSLRTQQEEGIWRHPIFTECKTKLITVSFNSREKEYFKAQQDTLDTTRGALRIHALTRTSRVRIRNWETKQKQKSKQKNHSLTYD